MAAETAGELCPRWEALIERLDEGLRQELRQLLEERVEAQLADRARCQTAGEKLKNLENESINANNELEGYKNNLLASEQKILELEKSMEVVLSEMASMQESFEIHKNNAENFRLQRDSAVEIQNSMTNMIETRNNEIDNLKKTIENYHLQLQAAINFKSDILVKNNSIRSNAFSINSCSAQEKFSLEKQIAILKNELQTCQADLHNTQKNFSLMKVRFERQVDAKNDELSVANAKIVKYMEIKDSLMKQVESLNERLAESVEKEKTITDDFSKELVAATKVGEMYKNLQEETSLENEKCTNALKELRQSCDDYNDKYEKLQLKLTETEAGHVKELARKDESIGLLKRELERANELLQFVDSDSFNSTLNDLSPSANMASRVLRSQLSLTQAFDQLVQISEELKIEKNENKRLTKALTTIIGELEEKVPVIDHQKTQYEEVIKNNAALTRQIDDLMLEHTSAKEENAAFTKLVTSLQKENNRLKEEIDDLGRQLCYLLKEIEVKRGRYTDANKSFSNSFSGSVDLNTSKDLVTFGDINELQSNNQKLLKLIRELSDKKQDAEMNGPSDGEDLEAKLEKLQSRVAELTSAHERQVKMINKLVEERDSYKEMCENNSQMSVDVSSRSLNKSVKLATGNNAQYTEMIESQMEDLRKELNDEREKHRIHVDRLKESELESVKNNSALQKNLNDLQSKFAKNISAMEIANEKIKIMQFDAATYKKDIDTLKLKLENYKSFAAKQEQSAKNFFDDLQATRAKLVQAESAMLKLRSEHANRRDDSMSSGDQSSVLKNIELIKNIIQQEDCNAVLKLDSALDEANKTCSILRCMLQEEQEKYHNLALHLKQEIDKSKAAINDEREHNKQLVLNIEQLQRESENKSTVIDELNKKYTNILYADKDDNVPLISVTSGEDSELKSQIKTLQEQLEVSKTYIEKYCQINEFSEKELKALNETHNDYKQKTEATLQELQSSENQLKEKCAQIERELALKTDNLTSTQSKLTELSNELNEKNSALEKALSDVVKITESAQSVEEKYGLEIILHSNDIKSLAELKVQLLEANKNANDTLRAKLEAENQLEIGKSNWENSERMLITENEEIKAQISDLRTQNSLLLDQLQTFGKKLTSMQSPQSLESSAEAIAEVTTGILNDIDAASSEQLLDIVKYLRREKDVLVTKFDIMQAENSRLRSQLEIIESQLDEAKLLDKSQTDVGTDTVRHSGIVRKIEKLNSISDCYVNLYKERDNLLNRIDELTERCNQLQEAVAPLEHRNIELSLQIEGLEKDNSLFKTEARKWKERVNTLIKRDNQPFPDDWRKIQNERDELAKTLSTERDNVKKLTEDAAKLKSDNTVLEDQIEKLRKQYTTVSETFKKRISELNTTKKENETINKEVVVLRSTVDEKNKEISSVSEKLAANETALTELRNKELQVRKVAKKFKDQYEELTKKVEEEKQKSALLASEAAVTSENHMETLKGVEQKNVELEKIYSDKINQLNNRVSSSTEENKKLLGEIESLKTANHDTEEKAKHLVKQAKMKILALTEAKETQAKELSDLQAKITNFEQNKDEKDVRLVVIKSQYDGRVAKLEKEKMQIIAEKQEEIAQLNKQIESLMSKISMIQRKADNGQNPKPSTSSNQTEKTGTEPPTANIKPMAGVASSPRDVTRRVTGDTPFASIRPMAMHSGIRTAAVLPTTAQASHTIAHHQTPHTTDMTSPSSSQHVTEYLPTSSSPMARLHPSQTRHISLPPPESTQDMDTDSVTCESDQSVATIIPSTPQQIVTSQPQQVALITPRMETPVDLQNAHVHQQASSSSGNNSSSTVTTTHAQNSNAAIGSKTDPRAFKRPRVALPRPPQKTILKRAKIQRIAESESEYQVPTSSQRDQEDDSNFGDSDDDESYQERVCEGDEDDVEDKERLEERVEENSVSVDREASGNEAEVTNNSSQDRNRSDEGDRSTDTHSADRETVPSMLSTSLQEQQIETISSGNGIDNNFLMLGGAGVSGVTSAVSGTYDDGDDSIVPSTPTLFMPTRNDGFGEAVRSPMTVRSQSNEGRFTFSESSGATGGAMEDTHADLAPQLTPHNHSSPGDDGVVLESSEADTGGNNTGDMNPEEDSSLVSSQGNTASFSSQVEEGREAEASTTGSNTPPNSWRRGRVAKSASRASTYPHTPRNTEHQRVVWNSEGGFRRGNAYNQHRAPSRGGRHPMRRPQTFFKRF